MGLDINKRNKKTRFANLNSSKIIYSKEISKKILQKNYTTNTIAKENRLINGDFYHTDGDLKVVFNKLVDPDFKFTIDTTFIDATTITDNHSFQLELQNGATDVVIEWGDGNSDVVTSNIDPVLLHDYGIGNEGVYQIVIKGSFEGIGNPPPPGSGGKNTDGGKWLSLDNWGTNSFTNMQASFQNCANMVGNYTDTPNTSSCTDMSFMFRNCSNFNSPVNFDTSSCTNLEGAFFECTLFNQPINWNTQNVVKFLRCFYNCSNFNSPVTLNGLLNADNAASMFDGCINFNSPVTLSTPSNITNMGAMFNRTSFNQDVSDWDVSNVTNMRFMFATSPFDQDLSNWDISGMLVPGAGGIASKMFYATSSFSTANYDLLLVAWNNYVVAGTTGIQFDAAVTKYSAGAPATARANMISFGWIIGDGGPV